MGITIWTMTSVAGYSNGEKRRKTTVEPRCWGYRSTEKDAINCVKDFPDSYSEMSHYTHVVIEKVPEYGSPWDKHPLWFELRLLNAPIQKTFTDKSDESTLITLEYEAVLVETPSWAKNICGWCIG